MCEGAFLFSKEMAKEGETRNRRDESKMKIHETTNQNRRRMIPVMTHEEIETVVMSRAKKGSGMLMKTSVLLFR